MKFSKYNVFYEHGDNFLLVNTRTGAMFTLDVKEKFEKYGIHSDAEIELYQQIPILEKYMKKNRKIKKSDKI
jgi:hypothetical protein|nr:MAG TPA: hypothetical protein [Caudoviricetes sp.]